MTPSIKNRFLFDTHTFLWWTDEPARLSSAAFAVLSDPNVTLLLSVVVLWEIQIKTQTGKLRPLRPLPQVVSAQITTNRMELLTVTPQHIYALDNLPLIHKDPFDRLLIAQTLVEGATLLTLDANITAYRVPTLW